MSANSSPEAPSPLNIAPQGSPPVDLRRMTSNSTLLTPPRENRFSTHTSHLQTSRLGSRSPSSIPSSPTSAHSSSSAIFERDIEPIGPPSPPTHHANPHRIPRSKGTEQLEQSVPSVLDSAASVLTSSSNLEDDHISVVAPARNGYRSGFASPIGSLRSRSRSPSPTGRTSLLLSCAGGSPPPLSPTQKLSIQTSPAVANPTITASSAPRKIPGRSSPSIGTPTSAYYSTLSSAESSPTTTTVEHHPQSFSPALLASASPLPPAQLLPAASPSSTFNSSPFTHTLNLSHPPSPSSKRLSFMSYSDLLASTPASIVPLSSFASQEPPPHIPSVNGFTQHNGTGAGSGSLHGVVRDRDSIAMLDDVGGEWEREGLGRGLEERLEALMAVPGKA
ncbi:hypothetical protein BJ138DRAFT_1109553 [Hygrophoropsis aurantiaca]|uniref:Uncharacterized protein n=1 Tax=Hygrophoropsis aurantiaca TaxID=72124 RepID=A0ACB8ASZ8_9AGAM|nr:hypothetical protein BJ138DRAFT_1109553 [Hygrophoropsis aurantiaca]